MSNKKEFAIGEEFSIAGVKIICQEATENEDCKDCELDSLCQLGIDIGYCTSEYRTDGKDVIFKVKE